VSRSGSEGPQHSSSDRAQPDAKHAADHSSPSSANTAGISTLAKVGIGVVVAGLATAVGLAAFGGGGAASQGDLSAPPSPSVAPTADPVVPIASSTTSLQPTTTIEPQPQPDPCQTPATAAKGDWEVKVAAEGLRGLPRAIACTAGGVLVHQKLDEDSLFIFANGQRGDLIAGVGLPRGNGDLYVFHTWQEIHTMMPTDSAPVAFATLPEPDFYFDAVPLGTDRILVTTGAPDSVPGSIALHDLNNNVLWSYEAGLTADPVLTDPLLGDPAYWVTDNEGHLFRVPLDGSDPGRPFAITDAIFPGTGVRRPPPTVVPVSGGAWITNADDTIQFISDEGVLGQKLDVGPPPTGDGVHVLPVRNLVVAGKHLFADDRNGTIHRYDLDGGNPATADHMPFTSGAGCVWYLRDDRLVAEDAVDGTIVFDEPLTNPDAPHFAWAHGALWIADQNQQNGMVYRVGVKS